jgi:hypothetical protein
MAKLYSNENFPLPVVERLRTLGHDVLTSLDAGNAGFGMPDERVLTFASGQGRVLLTLNRRHFVRLHEAGPTHSGIIACSFDSDFQGQADRIHAAISSSGELANQLIRVNRPSLPAAQAGGQGPTDPWPVNPPRKLDLSPD